jgi:hypothetical protein
MGIKGDIREHIKTFDVDHPTAENAAIEVVKMMKSMQLKDITEAIIIGVICAAFVPLGPAGWAAAGILSLVSAELCNEL